MNEIQECPGQLILLKNPPLRLALLYCSELFACQQQAACLRRSLTLKTAREGQEGGGEASLSLFRGTVTSGKVSQGKKAQSLSSRIWLCRATLQQQLQWEKKGFFLFPFFSHLLRLPLHSAFEELDRECWELVINSIYPEFTPQKSQPNHVWWHD